MLGPKNRAILQGIIRLRYLTGGKGVLTCLPHHVLGRVGEHDIHGVMFNVTVPSI